MDTNNTFSAVLTRQISYVKPSVIKSSHVVTFAKMCVEMCVHNIAWLNAEKLSHVNMKNVCRVLKIPWFTVSVTEIVLKSWTVAIPAQRDVQSLVNVTPELML